MFFRAYFVQSLENTWKAGQLLNSFGFQFLVKMLNLPTNMNSKAQEDIKLVILREGNDQEILIFTILWCDFAPMLAHFVYDYLECSTKLVGCLFSWQAG